jgi:UPF0042 nucleotide-binding protein
LFERFVVVAGLSGAGKSQAMKSLEDLGFYCVDNLPPAMLDEFVTIASRGGHRQVALALDARASGALGNALQALQTLHRHGVAFELLYLDASDEAIVRRYSETRRRHPLENDGKLTEAIEREREALAPLRALADRVWDTTQLSPSTLGGRVRAAYARDGRGPKLPVNLVAFGFKNGVPKDADLVFDVRFFLNPNYVPDLKERDGRHRAVADFMEALPETAPFLAHLFGMIDFLVPLYAGEGKSRLTIAVGCTGGRHRSVYVVDRLAEHLDGHEAIGVTREYRELPE